MSSERAATIPLASVGAMVGLEHEALLGLLASEVLTDASGEPLRANALNWEDLLVLRTLAVLAHAAACAPTLVDAARARPSTARRLAEAVRAAARGERPRVVAIGEHRDGPLWFGAAPSVGAGLDPAAELLISLDAVDAALRSNGRAVERARLADLVQAGPFQALHGTDALVRSAQERVADALEELVDRGAIISTEVGAGHQLGEAVGDLAIAAEGLRQARAGLLAIEGELRGPSVGEAASGRTEETGVASP